MAPSRKQTRKVNKVKKVSKGKKSRSARRQSGGGDFSLAQGAEFARAVQHGGALLTGAPVGDTGMLPDELRMAARVGGLDASFGQIQGFSDSAPMAQTGGRRTNSKKAKKAKKSKKSKKSRRQSGGARMLDGASLSESPMLLTPAQAARAGTADFSGAFAR